MARVTAGRSVGPTSSLVITVGAAQVIVRGGFDKDLLREVVEALAR